MKIIQNNSVVTRKEGAEDFIMLRLPVDRFRNIVPSHYNPPVDAKSRYNVAILAQDCEVYSFDNDEIGQTYEFHFWLQVESLQPDTLGKDVDKMLPSMHWIPLVSAVSTIKACRYLKSFGFNPLILENIDIRMNGGSLIFPKGKEIQWTILSRGKGISRVGVKHYLFMPFEGSDAVGHRVSAVVSDTEMEQPGKIRILTNTLEPFLFEGERFPASIHRMNRLEADVVWQRHFE